MIISTPVSLGELIDKISILHIKNIKNNDIQNYLDSLIEINSRLWVIEDDIRDCERNKKFDQTFIDLARSVYFTNDKRSEVKLEINKKFGSKIIEVKSYEEY